MSEETLSQILEELRKMSNTIVEIRDSIVDIQSNVFSIMLRIPEE